MMSSFRNKYIESHKLICVYVKLRKLDKQEEVENIPTGFYKNFEKK